mgnify:CR=1 FL=1
MGSRRPYAAGSLPVAVLALFAGGVAPALVPGTLAAQLLPDGGVEGRWIPKALADAHPEIRTVADALERPELFPAPEDDERGAVHGCPAGWTCQITTENLFRANDAEAKGFDLVDTGSSAGLDGSISRAVERGEGWLGYYWSSTALLGRYETVRLGTPEHDPVEWKRCTAEIGCLDPKPNGYPETEVFSVVTSRFAEEADVAMDYVRTRQWRNETVNESLAWMIENQATGEEAAYRFLETCEDVWGDWGWTRRPAGASGRRSDASVTASVSREAPVREASSLLRTGFSRKAFREGPFDKALP